MLLYDWYSEILNDPEAWNYYRNQPNNYPSMRGIIRYHRDALEDILQEQNACEFIQEYFRVGGKHRALDGILDSGCMKESMVFRCQHTVSAFFLGLVLARSFGDREFTFEIENERFDFTYVWFLTCLYHDIGYVFELDSDIQAKIRECPSDMETMVMLQRECNLFKGFSQEREIYKQIVTEMFSKKDIVAHIGETCLPVTEYWNPEYLMDSYFRYIVARMGKWDHGIVGSLLFLDRMMRNYAEKFIELKKEKENTAIKDFVVDGLRFHFPQLTLFRFISDCILAHNMWKAKDCDESCYRYFGLHQLIGKEYPKISVVKNPLLFILALVDTIEPIKMRPKEVFSLKENIAEELKGIEIDINTENRNRYIYYKNQQRDFEADRMKENIECWINVCVKKTSEMSLKIRIPDLQTYDRTNS